MTIFGAIEKSAPNKMAEEQKSRKRIKTANNNIRFANLFSFFFHSQSDKWQNFKQIWNFIGRVRVHVFFLPVTCEMKIKSFSCDCINAGFMLAFGNETDPVVTCFFTIHCFCVDKISLKVDTFNYSHAAANVKWIDRSIN